MNIDYALARRKELLIITDAYEAFLRKQLLRTQNRVRVAEALGAKDIMRTITMSKVSQKRVNKIIAPQTVSAIESSQQPLVQEAAALGTALAPRQNVSDPSNKKLFKDLEDCIPCDFKWDWEDFDWDRLKEILLADLKNRLSFLDGLADLFDGNPILDQLCEIIRSFRDLCPQDLLILIATLVAFIERVLETIDFNLKSAINDILASLLRPFIGGLEDFLSMYFQLLLDQIDCILNSIENSAKSLKGLSLSNDHGPKALHFRQRLTSEEMDQGLEDIADVASRTNKRIHDTADRITAGPDDAIAYIKAVGQDAIDWIEMKLTKVQDALIDLLGGEWLITQDNISLYAQVKAVATIIDICEVIANLGNLDELCSEDNIRQIIGELNKRSPDGTTIVIEDATNDRGAAGTLQVTPSASPQGTPLQVSKQVRFALKDCLKKASPEDEALIQQWRAELS
jgi:hypothetical protein